MLKYQKTIKNFKKPGENYEKYSKIVQNVEKREKNGQKCQKSSKKLKIKRVTCKKPSQLSKNNQKFQNS